MSLDNCDIDFFIFCHHSCIISPKFLKFKRVWNVAKKIQKVQKRKWKITKLNEIEWNYSVMTLHQRPFYQFVSVEELKNLDEWQTCDRYANHSKGLLLALLTNIRRAWKYLTVAYTLAKFAATSVFKFL